MKYGLRWCACRPRPAVSPHPPVRLLPHRFFVSGVLPCGLVWAKHNSEFNPRACRRAACTPRPPQCGLDRGTLAHGTHAGLPRICTLLSHQLDLKCSLISLIAPTFDSAQLLMRRARSSPFRSAARPVITAFWFHHTFPYLSHSSILAVLNRRHTDLGPHPLTCSLTHTHSLLPPKTSCWESIGVCDHWQWLATGLTSSHPLALARCCLRSSFPTALWPWSLFLHQPSPPHQLMHTPKPKPFLRGMPGSKIPFAPPNLSGWQSR